jgi:methylisocitrate lyase
MSEGCTRARRTRAAGGVYREPTSAQECGRLNDENLAEPRDMAAKIASARRARRHLYIIVHSDTG